MKGSVYMFTHIYLKDGIRISRNRFSRLYTVSYSNEVGFSIYENLQNLNGVINAIKKIRKDVI